jgi:prepilin-type N-terminal cleavage/methylation domain-containing protein
LFLVDNGDSKGDGIPLAKRAAMKAVQKRQQGVTLTELMIAMMLGLILHQAGYALYACYLKVHKQSNLNQFTQDQASYVFYWMYRYSRLAGFKSDQALGMSDISDDFKEGFAQHSHTTESQWLAFRMKLPTTERYSCEGSHFEWPDGRRVVSEVLVIFWLGSKQRLLCKTWVKKADQWCEMPIHKGQCTSFKKHPESLLTSINQFEFELYPKRFWIRLVIDAAQNEKIKPVFESQFLLRQKYLAYRLK